MNSFDFAVAEAALAEGFPPDSISTDQYARHIGSMPQHDLPRTLSKLIAVGMPEREAFAAVTTRPAERLGLAGEIGTLAPGAGADLAVLRFNPHDAPVPDVHGAERPGGCWEPVLTGRAGEPVSKLAPWRMPRHFRIFDAKARKERKREKRRKNHRDIENTKNTKRTGRKSGHDLFDCSFLASLCPSCSSCLRV